MGPGAAPQDARLDALLGSVPASRLPSHPGVDVDPEVRLRHARGQSLPDWIALRSGRIGVFPDGVAFPETITAVRDLLAFARRSGAHLIPYGGGTSVVGHINPAPGQVPSLTVDLGRLHNLVELDELSHLAIFEAGVRGSDLEAQLRQRGYTLGHYPQSFEYSTLGGWIATRSIGQQSLLYGRIEDLFAGGHLETPLGPLEIPHFPASAAGPDLRQLILGSEGRLGVITHAALRVRRLPKAEGFYGIVFRDWESGMVAAREVVQAGVDVSMLRLSDARETDVMLALGGRGQLAAAAERVLRGRGYGPDRCLLLLAVTGTKPGTRQARRQALAIAKSHGGLSTGTLIGEQWRRTRFKTPYLRNALWEKGFALDTLETAVPWSRVRFSVSAILTALQQGLANAGERVLAFAHLSHLYRDGASIYVTFVFRQSADPDETLDRWKVLKGAATEALLKHGGTISHQHGVGLDHAPYLKAEKGEVGMKLLEATRRALDPDGVLNPGKLLSDG